MLEGTVVSYAPERGFGYLRADGADKDIWFHIKAALDRDWVPVRGERACFDTGTNDKGPIAVNLLPLTTPTGANAAGAVTDGEIRTGAVRWFDEGKGFGFILGEDGCEYHVGTSRHR